MAKKKSILHSPVDLKIFAIIVLVVALGIAVWGLNNERNLSSQPNAAVNCWASECTRAQLREELNFCYKECDKNFAAGTNEKGLCRTECYKSYQNHSRECKKLGC